MATAKTQKQLPEIIGRGCDADGRQVFMVASRTTEGASYRVTRHEFHLSCNCPAGQWHPETPCCHRKAVHAALVAERDAQAKRVAAAKPRPAEAPLYRSNAGFSLFKAS